MPPEILRFILLELAEIEYVDYESAVPITDIKALRLSCRAFADLAPEYLFHDIWLYMEEDSLAKLKALADHPIYARMVRTLKIFPKLLSADLLVKEDYEMCAKDITFTGQGRETWGFDIDGKRNLSQEQLDAGFVEYNKLHGQQVQAKTRADTLLQHALAAFTGLRAITAGFVDEILDDEICFDHCSKIKDITRKTLMADRCDGWKSGIHDPEDAIMILKAIASSEREGLSLSLYNDFGSYDTTLVDIRPCDLDASKKALLGLDSLSLGLEAVSHVHLREVTDTGFLANFLEYAANVRYLCVENASIASMAFFFDTIFNTTQWSNLQAVTIYGLMVNGDDLISFVDRHSVTLEDIYLDMMILKSGTWKQVFVGMQGKRALEYFSAGNVFVSCWDSEQTIFLPIIYDATIDDLLYGFIFGGEPWSSELPAGYLQEAKWSEED